MKTLFKNKKENLNYKKNIEPFSTSKILQPHKFPSVADHSAITNSTNIEIYSDNLLKLITKNKHEFIQQQTIKINKFILKFEENDDALIDEFGYEDFKNLRSIIQGNSFLNRVTKTSSLIFCLISVILFLVRIESPPLIAVSLIISIIGAVAYLKDKKSELTHANKSKIKDWVNNIALKRYSKISIEEEHLLAIKSILNENEFIDVFYQDEGKDLNLNYDNPKLINLLTLKAKKYKNIDNKEKLRDIFKS